MFDTYTKCITGTSSVYPVVEYEPEVWGYRKDSSTNQLQLKAIRIFIGVHKFTLNLGIMRDTG